MKINILIVLPLLMLSQLVYAQNFDWVRAIGGIESEDGYSIATDSAGNVFVAGKISCNLGNVDSLSLYPSTGINSILSDRWASDFLCKYNSTGDVQWIRLIEGKSYEDRVLDPCIAVDPISNNIYISGIFYDTIQFDSSVVHDLISSSSVWNDAFLACYNQNGDCVWSKSFGGVDDDEPRTIATDRLGNIYISGNFWNTADFDPGPSQFLLTAISGSDAFICKFNDSGDFLWAKSFDADKDYGSIAIDRNNNILITGSFTDTVDFNPGFSNGLLFSGGAISTFILKLDSGGNFIWVKQIYSNDQARGMAVCADPSRNIYVTGDFKGTTDFDPSGNNYFLTSAGQYDIFICKLDSDGNFIRAESFGNNVSDEQGWAVSANDERVCITGKYYLQTDFDPGPSVYNLSTHGSDDIFLLTLDSSGDFVSAYGMGGQFGDLGMSVILDKESNVYLTGVFQMTASFGDSVSGNTLTSLGSVDCFTLKFKNTVTGIIENPIGNLSVRYFPNPTTGDVNVHLNKILDTFDVTISDIRAERIGYFIYKNTQHFNFNINNPGFYFITVHSECINYTFKVVVVK